MRAKFGEDIYFCTKATHKKGKSSLILTTNDDTIFVIMNCNQKADEAYDSLLINGYYDFSDTDYSN